MTTINTEVRIEIIPSINKEMNLDYHDKALQKISATQDPNMLTSYIDKIKEFYKDKNMMLILDFRSKNELVKDHEDDSIGLEFLHETTFTDRFSIEETEILSIFDELDDHGDNPFMYVYVGDADSLQSLINLMNANNLAKLTYNGVMDRLEEVIHAMASPQYDLLKFIWTCMYSRDTLDELWDVIDDDIWVRLKKTFKKDGLILS